MRSVQCANGGWQRGGENEAGVRGKEQRVERASVVCPSPLPEICEASSDAPYYTTHMRIYKARNRGIEETVNPKGRTKYVTRAWETKRNTHHGPKTTVRRRCTLFRDRTRQTSLLGQRRNALGRRGGTRQERDTRTH